MMVFNLDGCLVIFIERDFFFNVKDEDIINLFLLRSEKNKKWILISF
jgi:hypothetical protein